MVLVGVPVLYGELENYKETLLQSISNFTYVFAERVSFLIVVQSKGQISLPDWLKQHRCVVVRIVDWLSVSRARNLCLEFAQVKSFEKIIFHDASLIYPRAVCEFFHSNYSEALVKACAGFGDETSHGEHPISRVRKIGNIADYYVWLYMFSVKSISNKFDESFGPGEFTTYKSGEDFLFMAAFFKAFEKRPVLEITSPKIWHPARPKDLSKHLYYALGQGKLFQVLLRNFFEVKYLVWFLLFIGNAIFRVVFFKPNAFKILKQRLKGFFS